ncbi:hypothetical protein HOI26_00070, partial [Candidatus Woesearchaeota archaeon]|nr:hypothetical protein [Candidatus Woesearchaeota archaeon]
MKSSRSKITWQERQEMVELELAKLQEIEQKSEPVIERPVKTVHVVNRKPIRENTGVKIVAGLLVVLAVLFVFSIHSLGSHSTTPGTGDQGFFSFFNGGITGAVVGDNVTVNATEEIILNESVDEFTPEEISIPEEVVEENETIVDNTTIELPTNETVEENITAPENFTIGLPTNETENVTISLPEVNETIEEITLPVENETITENVTEIPVEAPSESELPEEVSEPETPVEEVVEAPIVEEPTPEVNDPETPVEEVVEDPVEEVIEVPVTDPIVEEPIIEENVTEELPVENVTPPEVEENVTEEFIGPIQLPVEEEPVVEPTPQDPVENVTQDPEFIGPLPLPVEESIIEENVTEIVNETIEEPLIEQSFGFAEEISPFAGPDLTSVVLNSSSLGNSTNENLTVTTDQDDNASVKLIYNWKKDSNSITVLNMPFENNTADPASTTKDYSGNSNNGTINSATWNSTGGYDGFGAYEFNTDDLINLSTFAPSISPEDNDWAISLWTKTTMTGTGQLFSSSNSIASLTDWVQFDIGVSVAGQLRLQVDDGTDPITSLTYNGINDGNWHHVFVTRDASLNNWSLYVDGSFQTSDTNTDSSVDADVVASIGNLIILNPNIRFFNGTIDDVQIFNRTLSPEQISALYNNRTDLIVSQETSAGDVWQVDVTANDGTGDSAVASSGNLTVLSNGKPVVSNVVLNATNINNNTNQNLTTYWDVSDADGDNVKNITNWYLNSTSITVLNMPFEENGSASTKAHDYSSLNNYGSVTGATFNPTGGYDGFGAYDFDDNNDYILLTQSISDQLEKKSDGWTITTWLYATTTSDTDYFFNARSAANTDEIRLAITPTVIALTYDDDTFGASNCLMYGSYTNAWHHITMKINSTDLSCYVDGALINTTDVSGSANLVSLGVATLGERWNLGGHRAAASADYYDGYIDDLMIWNKTLSDEQILNIYNNQSYLLDSNETSVGDVWSATITPNDGTEDGTTVTSNNVTIA